MMAMLGVYPIMEDAIGFFHFLIGTMKKCIIIKKFLYNAITIW